MGEFEGLFAQIALKYPVFLGEFGSSEDLTMDLDAVKQLLSLAQQLQIGWTAWNFSASAVPSLTDEATFTPSEYGEVVKQALTTDTILYDYPALTLESYPDRYLSIPIF